MTRLLAVLLLWLLGAASGPCRADQIILPGEALERDGEVVGIYRLDMPSSGRGELRLEWTDGHDRVVARQALAVSLQQGRDLRFALDLRRAAALQNELSATLWRDGKAGAMVRRRFIARPPVGWPDFPIIMWQSGSASRIAALKRLGMNAGMVIAQRTAGEEAAIAERIAPLLAADLRWYVENVGTDFYAAYHRWTPDRPVDWQFLEARRRYRENPGDQSVFFREPSLSDPVWLQRVAQRLHRTVAAHRPYRPLFYDLADEPGIADQIKFWDFDRSPPSLAGLRDWLRQRYGGLDTLNRQWGTAFADWTQVSPDTTPEAMRREDGNFSSWADFKEWMDEAFARAIKAGTEALHDADPTALAAIAGTQPPSWSFDYSRLVRAVDVMEIYDLGGAIELVRSLAPRVRVVTTGFGSAPRQLHGLWRALLRGSSGLVVWDDKDEVAQPDGAIGPRGIAYAATFAELRRGLGDLLAGAEQAVDPVAILYSPSSQRVQWMLDWKPRGEAWSQEATDADTKAVFYGSSLEAYARLVKRLGWQTRFVTAEQLETDVLRHCRVLILPHAIALPQAGVAAIRGFVDAGGTVIAEGMVGTFDAHGRRREQPPLDDLFAADHRPGAGRAIRLALADRQPERILPLFQAAGLTPLILPHRPDGAPDTEVETYRYRNGEITLLALLPVLTDQQPTARAVTVTLPEPMQVYDVRAGTALGRQQRLALTLDPFAPVVLALAKTPLPRLALAMPGRARPGDVVAIAITPLARSPAAVHPLHVEVIDPAGVEVTHYSGNLLAAGGRAERRLPLAFSDRPGTWTVRVTDALSGQRVEQRLVVAR